MTTTITVIGLGAMGLPMATNLAEDFTVNGVDINPERLDLAKKAGITTFTDSRAAVANADVVLLAVRNQAQLEEALFGLNGIVEAMQDGATVLLTSTVGIAGVEKAAGDLAAVSYTHLTLPTICSV